MGKKILVLLSISFLLQGCGGPQPSGDLESCVGSLSYAEYGGSVLQQRTVTDIQQVGQYVNISQGIIAQSLMIQAGLNSVTGIEVAVYKFNLDEFINSNTVPLAKMIVTETSNESDGLWLKLPTPFEFQARTANDIALQQYYFITFRALAGNFTLDVRQRRGPVGLLAGFRMGSPISWANTSTGMSMAIGFRGESNCQSSYQQ